MTSHAGTISLIAQAFRSLDLTLPKAYVKGLADLKADRDRLEGLPTYDSAALADAVLDALRTGKDPAGSAAVQRHLAAQQLHVNNARNVVSDRLDHRTIELLDDHADALHAAMAEQLATFDTLLAKSREVLPAGIDLSDPASASVVKPEHLPAWGNARATIDKIDRIAQAWKVLAAAARSLNVVNDDPLVVAALTASERDALGHRPRASAAALAGYTLSLATFDEFAERKARIGADRQAEVDARPTFADAYRRTHGTGARETRVFSLPHPGGSPD